MVAMQAMSIISLKCVLLIWFVVSIPGFETLSQACDSNDLIALNHFAGNLTNAANVFNTSSTKCCEWDGVSCDNSSANNNASAVSRVISLFVRTVLHLLKVPNDTEFSSCNNYVTFLFPFLGDP